MEVICPRSRISILASHWSRDLDTGLSLVALLADLNTDNENLVSRGPGCQNLIITIQIPIIELAPPSVLRKYLLCGTDWFIYHYAVTCGQRRSMLDGKWDNLNLIWKYYRFQYHKQMRDSRKELECNVSELLSTKQWNENLLLRRVLLRTEDEKGNAAIISFKPLNDFRTGQRAFGLSCYLALNVKGEISQSTFCQMSETLQIIFCSIHLYDVPTTKLVPKPSMYCSDVGNIFNGPFLHPQATSWPLIGPYHQPPAHSGN